MKYNFIKLESIWIKGVQDFFREKSFEEKTDIMADSMFYSMEGHTIEEQSDAIHKLKALIIAKRIDDLVRARSYVRELENNLLILGIPDTNDIF